jgi:hypothetical protein
LSFTILFKSSMLPSMCRWIQPMLECRFHPTSRAFDSNVLANALIGSGILCSDSARSRTEAISWYRNSIFWKIASFWGCCKGFLGYKIRRGVVRRFRVVAWVLRPFPGRLSHVRSNGRIPSGVLVSCYHFLVANWR